MWYNIKWNAFVAIHTNFMDGDDMLYKYETHCHTSEGSKCSKLDGASFAQFYKSLGYTGLFITDHFYKGNTAVPRDLPWDEWVTAFVKGYENAKAEGDKIGLDVFFAWEYSGDYGADFLIYGLGADWLYANPEQIQWSTEEYMTRVREAGGTVVHAHPFRRPQKLLLPNVTDGVEIINAPANDEDNFRAQIYAKSYGLPGIGGSDNHKGIQKRLGGVYLPERISPVREFTHFLKIGVVKAFVDCLDDDGSIL